MNKDVRLLFLTGLVSLRGELTEDFCISYYLGEKDSMLNFGFWLDERLSDEEFDSLVRSNRKDQLVMDYYRQYLNTKIDWDSKDFDYLHDFKTVDEMNEFLNERRVQMRRRWALEKQANGGFTMMDHWTLNPDELDEILRPGMEAIERGDVISSDEAMKRLRERLEKEVFGDE